MAAGVELVILHSRVTEPVETGSPETQVQERRPGVALHHDNKQLLKAVVSRYYLSIVSTPSVCPGLEPVRGAEADQETHAA